MAWFLQTPASASPKLLANIITGCGPASKGAAAFAFASSAGIKMLTSDDDFQKFLETSEFAMVVGLDAITDTNALNALQALKDKYPKFKPRLFLHDISGSCFHPKTMWFRTSEGGVTITGSGNLTAGGLESNWEALAVEKLTTPEIDQVERNWNKWVAVHEKELLDIDNEKARAKAKANRIQRVRVKRALKLSEDTDGPAEDVVESAIQDLMVNPVLIAEVPRSGNRWKQVNFDVRTYQDFFGVTLGRGKDVEFHHVLNDGTLGPTENRHAVAVKSRNYRFEIGAAQGIPYPKSGHPIVIFEKVTDSRFNYMLLMSPSVEYQLVQKYLDNNYSKTKGKRRVVISAGSLQAIWPACPLFM